jgi:hypothetical protein
VQCIRRGQGKSDLLVLSPATEEWLRCGYRTRMSTPAVLRDLGPILAHGEPESGMGQGDTAETHADPPSAEPTAPVEVNPTARQPAKGNGAPALVSVDFARLGPRTPDAA